MLLITTAVAAQPIALDLGETAQQVRSTGESTRVPMIVRLPTNDPEGLAALQLTIRWDTAALAYDSLRVVRGSTLTMTVNPEAAGFGLLRVSAFSAEALVRSGAVLELFYTLRIPRGRTALMLEVEAAGDAMGRDIRPRVRTRGHVLCATPCDDG
jgi:hypothetical protein